MHLSIGIIGLPNVGKSTLFKALTKQAVDISNYPFCTIEPNVGVVAVPDERLIALGQALQPPKITPAVIEFVDIAGLVKNAHQGEGLGNQFLARLREVTAICQVVRNFRDEKISHLEGEVNPQRDIEIINTELIMKDLETVNKRLEKTQKQGLPESNDLEQIKKSLEQGLLLQQKPELLKNQPLIKELSLLTAKPMLYVFNADSPAENKASHLNLNLKSEAELTELSPEEQKELEMPLAQISRLIESCYQLLDLITFYTIKGGQELRAWPLFRGLKAPQAGGLVHNDFEEKFIKAEVINYLDLIKAKTWSNARSQGLIRLEGKEYLVQDSDVIEFKI